MSGSAARTHKAIKKYSIPDRLTLIAESIFRACGRHPSRSIILLSLIAFLLSAGLSYKDWPVPYVHDEFAYLLEADTFARGRLTNKPHEHREHFETFHVLQEPTYQGKYPPASSMFMAVGIILTGHAIAGVWISTALAVCAVCWMLAGWLPSRWAMLGGFITALHPGILFLWGQSYWGGSVPLLGGALALGASRRLFKRWAPLNAFYLGLGFLILAHSRPFEGIILSIPMALLLLYKLIMLLKTSGYKKAFPAFLVLVLMLIIIILSVAVYNRTVTGNIMKFPHTLWSETYMDSDNPVDNPRLSQYSGSPMGSPLFRLERIIWFYLGFWLALPFLLVKFDSAHMLVRIFVMAGLLFVILGLAFPFLNLRPHMVMIALLLLQAIMIFQSTRNPWILSALGILVLVSGISIRYSHAWPHYIAPAAPLMLFLLLQAVRVIRSRDLSPSIPGRYIVFALPLIVLFSTAFLFFRHPAPEPPSWDRLGVYSTPGWSRDRAYLQDSFESEKGLFLIFVRYSEWYNIHCEWVYNKAGIDDAKVVWAHDLGDKKNAGLIKYFGNRSAWLLDLGKQPADLRPYTPDK